MKWFCIVVVMGWFSMICVSLVLLGCSGFCRGMIWVLILDVFRCRWVGNYVVSVLGLEVSMCSSMLMCWVGVLSSGFSVILL